MITKQQTNSSGMCPICLRKAPSCGHGHFFRRLYRQSRVPVARKLWVWKRDRYVNVCYVYTGR